MRKTIRNIGLCALTAVLVAGGFWAVVTDHVLVVSSGHDHLQHRPMVLGPLNANAQQGQKWTCGMHPLVIRDEPGLCPICEMDLTPLRPATTAPSAEVGERKIKYWVAPMDPSYIRDEPGKSPMGMDLVPVYENEAASGAVITIDPVTVQNMGIRSETVGRRDLARVVRTVGQVEIAETRQYSVNSKVAGWVEKLYVNTTGQQIRTGQPLLEIYSPQLVTAQQEYLLALQHQQAVADSPFSEIAAGGRRLLQAARTRLELWDISLDQIASLEQRGEIRKTMTLLAPYSGVVTQLAVTEGLAVKAGTELFELADLSQVWVQAQLFESDLAWIEAGQQVEVRLPYGDHAAGRSAMAGRLEYIYPYADSATRSVAARIVLDNPQQHGQRPLKPQMFVDVWVKSRPRSQVLTLPADAILDSGEVQTVFIALGKGRFEPRQVKTGVRDDQGYVEVIQGVLEGEQVVISAQFMLDSESQLREAIRKMLEPQPSVPTEPAAVEGDALEELF